MIRRAQVPGFRLSAATGTHRGDRPYQQDQVETFSHPRHSGCMLLLVADGMGGKSGGRKAADQVLLTARQLFEHFVPTEDSPEAFLRQVAAEAHLMIKLTAIAAEEEPHSTLAASLVMPDRQCHWVHAGDSRLYHFRGPELLQRSYDHSFVQRLIDEGKITEAEAAVHPQSNLLTGCLGTVQEPEPTSQSIGRLEVGDTLIACSDGLWHYFSPRELGTVLHGLAPRAAAELLVDKARERARGGGDNLSLAVVRVEAIA